MPKFKQNRKAVEAAFDRDALAETCIRPEADFGEFYGMQRVEVDDRLMGRWADPDENFYFFRDNGSTVLAVAHLDTVVEPHLRRAAFVDTVAGPIVYSGALDDRLGAYIILHLLPALGINYDILLTVGEEQGMSTAQHFSPPAGKEYDWIIEFDRGGTDVVMYDYQDDDTVAAVRATGAHVGNGSFSDISYMEHLRVKGWNWGVGYRDYHGPRGHAYLDDTMDMVARYLKFHQQNEGYYFPHQPRVSGYGMRSLKSTKYWWDEDDAYSESALIEPELVEDPDLFDLDYVNDNPTMEDIQRLEERLDRERERGLHGLDDDWMRGVMEDARDARREDARIAFDGVSPIEA